MNAMSDQEPSGFNVVDRRANRDDSAPASHSTAVPSENSSETLSEADAAPPQAVPETTPSTPPDNAAQEIESTLDADDESMFPEPGMLLGMAALQMETRDLAQALLPLFDAKAWQSLGLVANPLTGAATKDLPAAQLAIDCVQFLLSKIESGLSDSERRESQRRLSDLRMNYLAKMKE